MSFLGSVILSFLALLGTSHGYCNYGLVDNFYPIATGECGYYIDSDTFSFYSFLVECDGTGNATLYEFGYSLNCSGTVTNMTSLDNFDCDTNGNCNEYNDVYDLYLLGYNDTSCAGDWSQLAVLPLAVTEESYCVEDLSSGNYSASQTVNFKNTTYGINGYVYLGSSNCSGGIGGYAYLWPNFFCSGDYNNDTSTLWIYIERDNETHTYTTTEYELPTTTYDDSGSSDAYLYGYCNYALWNYFPVATEYCLTCSGDECGSDGTTSIYITCIDDNEAAIVEFDASYCSGDVVSVNFTDAYCYNYSSTCDSDEIILMSLNEYDNDECDEADLEFNVLFPLAKYSYSCVNLGGVYGLITVNINNGLTVGYYFDEYCDDTSIFNFTLAPIDECNNDTLYEFLEYNLTVVESNFECNFGGLGLFPLADGECGTCEGDKCGDTYSIDSICIDNNDAYIFEYESDDCEDGVTNITMADLYQCDLSDSDCDDDDKYQLIISQYDDQDCSGAANTIVTLTLAAGDACIGIPVSPFIYYYLGIESSQDGIYIGGYLDSECDEYMIFNESYGYIECINDGDNSTLYSFFPIIGTSTTASSIESTSSDSASDTPQSTSSATLKANQTASSPDSSDSNEMTTTTTMSNMTTTLGGNDTDSQGTTSDDDSAISLVNNGGKIYIIISFIILCLFLYY